MEEDPSKRSWLSSALTAARVAPNHPAARLLRRAGRLPGPNMVGKTRAAHLTIVELRRIEREHKELELEWTELEESDNEHPDNKGWIKWEGKGLCPIPHVPSGKFDIRFKDESRSEAVGYMYDCDTDAIGYDWYSDKENPELNIIEYRITDPEFILEEGVVYLTLASLERHLRWCKWQNNEWKSHETVLGLAKDMTWYSNHQRDRVVVRRATKEELENPALHILDVPEWRSVSHSGKI